MQNSSHTLSGLSAPSRPAISATNSSPLSPLSTSGSTMQQNKEAHSGQTWRSRTLIAALFLMVFASKLALLNAFASPLPFWDQWDAEAANLYKPYLDGSLSWQALFASHNEHRIII